MDEHNPQPKRQTILHKFDAFIKRFIPNGNVRAILYLSLLFGIALQIQIWRMLQQPPQPQQNQETVIADNSYWDSAEYQDKIKNQTIESFTNELQGWLANKDQEFFRRKFEDVLFINTALPGLTGEDLAAVVPANFNYLENHAKARYQYAQSKGFLADKPAIVKLGELVCDSSDKVETNTGIELYEWRYASMPKLAEFMKSKPDWKVQVGSTIYDVSEPRIEDEDILKLKTGETQPAGLFSFLVFRDPQTNRIYLADSHILDSNAVDATLTFARLTLHYDTQPKLHFKAGYESCKQLINPIPIDYGHVD